MTERGKPYQKKWECRHCGKCCLAIPCVFARVKYQIFKDDGKICPALVKDGIRYKCRLIEENAEARAVLLDGQCDDPDKDYLKKKIDAVVIVREFFPSATNEEISNILWSYTGFPNFWNIPEDGWMASQCLRKQLSDFKAQRCSQEVMEL